MRVSACVCAHHVSSLHYYTAHTTPTLLPYTPTHTHNIVIRTMHPRQSANTKWSTGGSEHIGYSIKWSYIYKVGWRENFCGQLINLGRQLINLKGYYEYQS